MRRETRHKRAQGGSPLKHTSKLWNKYLSCKASFFHRKDLEISLGTRRKTMYSTVSIYFLTRNKPMPTYTTLMRIQDL